MKHIKVFETTYDFEDWKEENLKTFPYACFCMDSGITYYQDYVNMNPGEYDYVDLDLPSGTLWSTVNLGASDPEDYGDYNAWGENGTKNNFTVGTYYWGNGEDEGLYEKYNYSDGKTRLDRCDDPVYGAWSWDNATDWHIPTADQWEELLDERYTTREITTINNVSGMKISSISDSSAYIFLPFAGTMVGQTLTGAGTSAAYLSMDIYDVTEKSMSSGGNYCYAFIMDNSDPSYPEAYLYRFLRYHGGSIRPVVGNKSFKYVPETPPEVIK